MENYSITRTPAVYAGTKALSRLGGLAQNSGAASAVVLADAALQDAGHLKRVLEALGDFPARVLVLPPGEPTVQGVNDAVAFARTEERPLVLGVGGGSTLDTAKQVAAVVTGEAGLEHYLLAAHRFGGRAPLIAVPTTAGTGAEATRVCVVSDAQGRKLWTWGAELVPDAVLLDPSLTLTLPEHVTVMTALDALVHAVEACTSARRNSVASAFGLQAVRLIQDFLPRVLEAPQDLTARQRLQEAAYLAGVAFDQSALGVMHAIGHALGTLYHLPHGAAVTLALDTALDWNTRGREEAFGPLALAFGTTPGDLPLAVRAFIDSVRFRRVMQAMPVVRIDPDALADTMNADENRSLLLTNVRAPSAEERLELARATRAAYARWT